MTAKMHISYEPAENSAWTLELQTEEGATEAIVSLFWSDKQSPTHQWVVPLKDVERLVDFAKLNVKQE